MRASKKNKLIFEVPRAQKEGIFKQVLENAMKDAFAKEVPMIYRNKLCVKRNQFIHFYPDGRTFLIEQDQNNSKEKILKVLN